MEARRSARARRLSLLADILATKQREVAALRARARVGSVRTPVDAFGALRRAGDAPLRLVTEVKLRSPSACSTSSAIATSCVRASPGCGVRLTRMVSPMPSCSSTPSATAEATVPLVAIPASVRPRCSA